MIQNRVRPPTHKHTQQPPTRLWALSVSAKKNVQSGNGTGSTTLLHHILVPWRPAHSDQHNSARGKRPIYGGATLTQIQQPAGLTQYDASTHRTSDKGFHPPRLAMLIAASISFCRRSSS